MDFNNLLLSLKQKEAELSWQKDRTIYCYKCGREMIKRKSKWGGADWWGCSGYPQCKNTIK
jgi:ssDNA-binding Zn-finger/Zn-ribbon topoisomerase 1